MKALLCLALSIHNTTTKHWRSCEATKSDFEDVKYSATNGVDGCVFKFRIG